MRSRTAWLAAACTCLLVWPMLKEDTFAASEVYVTDNGEEREVTVYSDIQFTDPEGFIPESRYTDEEGRQYWLESWSAVPAVWESRTAKEQVEIFYEGGEGTKLVPDRVQSVFRDEVTGRQVTEEFRMAGLFQENERWSGDFSFLAVFHGYDSDYFRLGNREVPFHGDKPQLMGLEGELLAEIGVNSENYRILDSKWEGPAYMDDGGVLCRNAVVTGEKKVWDYQARYGGEVTFPQVQGFKCAAIYTSYEKKTEADGKALQESEPSGQLSVEAEEKPPSVWELIRHVVVAVIGIFTVLLVIALLIWLITRRKKKPPTLTQNL